MSKPFVDYTWRLISRDKADNSNYPSKAGSYHCLLSDGSIDSIMFMPIKLGNETKMSIMLTKEQDRYFNDNDVYILGWFPMPSAPSGIVLDWLVKNSISPRVACLDEEVLERELQWR